LPEYRGYGLGKALIAASVKNLTQRKFCGLSLTVTEANSPAVELYKRLGFETRRVFDAFVWEG
jgi:ribosomal protein S18 acetylase RimI-like enzyme